MRKLNKILGLDCQQTGSQNNVYNYTTEANINIRYQSAFFQLTYDIEIEDSDSFNIFIEDAVDGKYIKLNSQPLSKFVPIGSINISEAIYKDVLNDKYVVENVKIRFAITPNGDYTNTEFHDVTISKFRYISITSVTPDSLTGLNAISRYEIFAFTWNLLYNDNETLRLSWKSTSGTEWTTAPDTFRNDGYFAFSPSSIIFGGMASGTYQFRFISDSDPLWSYTTGQIQITNDTKAETGANTNEYFGPIDRYEYGARLAGEKAQLPDEALMKGQLVPGYGIRIKWYDKYGADPDDASQAVPINYFQANNVEIQIDESKIKIPKYRLLDFTFSYNSSGSPIGGWSLDSSTLERNRYTKTIILSTPLTTINSYDIEIKPYVYIGQNKSYNPANRLQLYYEPISNTQIRFIILPLKYSNNLPHSPYEFNWEVKIIYVELMPSGSGSGMQ